MSSLHSLNFYLVRHGECLHVGAGYHIVGMKAEGAPDIAVTRNKGDWAC